MDINTVSAGEPKNSDWKNLAKTENPPVKPNESK
jgi:hypothetical protein